MDASTGGPAVIGVLLVLDKEMSELLTSGGFNDVMSMVAGSLEAAAGACGATVDGIDITGILLSDSNALSISAVDAKTETTSVGNNRI